MMATTKTVTRQKFNPNMNQKGYPILAVEQYERVILAHNVEFRGGFYIQMPGNNGNTTEVYVPDTREVFCNSCHVLGIISRYTMNDKGREEYEKINEKIRKNEQKFLERSSVKEEVILGEAFYEKTEDKIFREEYIMKKVRLYQELFTLVTHQFGYKKFFQNAATDD